ncbi:CubicO group peptidase, beta-lactamase class C family [Tenacibaculum sp. MAR_2009_124]|uniref:serine hydrolase domain-containing protein n=1 Tax=Tenacibaculum sp. MAR_2009_124 TaxID=1250059 RepID=UPI00089C1B3C|nr:serine hydrolase domain-containing protein [Tenacibaculum sp. MAR_2009_124]SEC93676.1 CubicO group peptidase, beta-lactamase class C family [Tenacibaculum sp. MAR_2009_124]
MKKTLVLISTFVLSYNAPIFSQTVSSSIFDKTDDYVKEMMMTNEIIGLNYAILIDGVIVHKKHMGYANFEHQVPMTNEKLFAVASISKLFSSTALHKLLLLNHRNVNEVIGDFLPERTDLPSSWLKLPLRQILSHTSGIPDQIDYHVYLAPNSDNEVINAMKDKPFSAKPGEKSKYNATGFFLIRLVIEKLSGEGFETHMKKHYFEKLKLSSAQYGGFKNVIKNRVKSYRNVNDKLEMFPLNYSPTMYAAAGLNINLDDLILWFQNVYNERILSKEVLNKVWTPVHLNNGKPGYFGLGWEAAKVGDNIHAVGHGGAGISSVRHFYGDGLKQNISVIFLTNGAKNWKIYPNSIGANIANIVMTE